MHVRKSSNRADKHAACRASNQAAPSSQNETYTPPADTPSPPNLQTDNNGGDKEAELYQRTRPAMEQKTDQVAADTRTDDAARQPLERYTGTSDEKAALQRVPTPAAAAAPRTAAPVPPQPTAPTPRIAWLRARQPTAPTPRIAWLRIHYPSHPALIPFLGDDIFVLIAAELDTRMLGRLGCAEQRFARPSVPDPAHQGRAPAELWSVPEEGARRRLCAQSEQVRGWVCRGGVGGSWLRALAEAEKLQRPLRFTACAELRRFAGPPRTATEGIELGEEGRVATQHHVAPCFKRSAVCGEHEMRRGRHYANFTLGYDGFGPSLGLRVGVVGAGFHPTSDVPLALSNHCWSLSTRSGDLWHGGGVNNWEGQPRYKELKRGDVVVRLPPPNPCPPATLLTLLRAVQGLLLDLDATTLTVYVNGEWKGVMVRPGMMVYLSDDSDEDDSEDDSDDRQHPVARLEGPLRWAVDVGSATRHGPQSVAIGGPLLE